MSSHNTKFDFNLWKKICIFWLNEDEEANQTS